MCPFFMLKYFSLSWILLLAFQSKATIQFELNPQIVTTYESGISFNISAMQKQLLQLKQHHNSNGFVLLLDNYSDFIRLLADENVNQYKSALAARNKRFQRLQLADKSSPFYYYSLAECYIQWAFIRLRFNDKVHAANDLRKAVSYLSEGQKHFPHFTLFLKPQAMVSAMAAAVPPNFKWVAEIVGIKGNMNVSMLQLDSLSHTISRSKKWNFLQSEINFMRLFISQNLNQKELSSILIENETNKPLIDFGLIWASAKNHKSSYIIQHIPELKASIRGLNFCYLDYLLAEARLNQLENPEKEIQTFLKNHQGTTFIKSAYRRLAWYSLINLDTVRYHKYMQQVLINGSDFTDDDKQANDEALSNGVPNVSLLKARLLFDGGDFHESLSILTENLLKSLSLKEKLEFYYRKARCLQLLNDTESAILNFERTIAIGERLPYYFAAASAYQLGVIYNQQGNTPLAKTCFKKVSRFPNHAYKISLDMKAAAELSK